MLRAVVALVTVQAAVAQLRADEFHRLKEEQAELDDILAQDPGFLDADNKTLGRRVHYINSFGRHILYESKGKLRDTTVDLLNGYHTLTTTCSPDQTTSVVTGPATDINNLRNRIATGLSQSKPRLDDDATKLPRDDDMFIVAPCGEDKPTLVGSVFALGNLDCDDSAAPCTLQLHVVPRPLSDVMHSLRIRFFSGNDTLSAHRHHIQQAEGGHQDVPESIFSDDELQQLRDHPSEYSHVFVDKRSKAARRLSDDLSWDDAVALVDGGEEPLVDFEFSFSLWNYDASLDQAEDAEWVLYEDDDLTVTCESCYLGIKDGLVYMDMDSSASGGINDMAAAFAATLTTNVDLKAEVVGQYVYKETIDIIEETCVPSLCIGSNVMGIGVEAGVKVMLPFNTEATFNGELVATAGFDASLTATVTVDSQGNTSNAMSLEKNYHKPTLEIKADATLRGELVPEIKVGAWASLLFASLTAEVYAKYVMYLEARLQYSNTQLGLPDRLADGFCDAPKIIGDCDSKEHDTRLALLAGADCYVGYLAEYRVVISDSIGEEIHLPDASLGPFLLAAACECILGPTLGGCEQESTCGDAEEEVVKIQDCDGTEFPESYNTWVGDGGCDDSSPNFDCESYSYDGGDCISCPVVSNGATCDGLITADQGDVTCVSLEEDLGLNCQGCGCDWATAKYGDRLDCDGASYTLAEAAGIGDGICDDGSGSLPNFSCSKFGCDGGDCVHCLISTGASCSADSDCTAYGAAGACISGACIDASSASRFLGFCASDESTCLEGDGHCSVDSDCSGDLVCGSHNCADYHPDATGLASASCCTETTVTVDPTCPATCLGGSNCDAFSLSCATLEDDYGCDCSACTCAIDNTDCTDCQGNDCGEFQHWIGDGFCDAGQYDGIFLNCEAHNCDGGDCPSSNCAGTAPVVETCSDCDGNSCEGYEYWIGDGWCDEGSVNFNCVEFSCDGGDCGNCDGSTSSCTDCDGYDCEGFESWVGDGLCDDEWSLFNFECSDHDCDGGDCSGCDSGSGGSTTSPLDCSSGGGGITIDYSTDYYGNYLGYGYLFRRERRLLLCSAPAHGLAAVAALIAALQYLVAW